MQRTLWVMDRVADFSVEIHPRIKPAFMSAEQYQRGVCLGHEKMPARASAPLVLSPDELRQHIVMYAPLGYAMDDWLMEKAYQALRHGLMVYFVDFRAGVIALKSWNSHMQSLLPVQPDVYNDLPLNSGLITGHPGVFLALEQTMKARMNSDHQPEFLWLILDHVSTSMADHAVLTRLLEQARACNIGLFLRFHEYTQHPALATVEANTRFRIQFSTGVALPVTG